MSLHFACGEAEAQESVGFKSTSRMDDKMEASRDRYPNEWRTFSLLGRMKGIATTLSSVCDKKLPIPLIEKRWGLSNFDWLIKPLPRYTSTISQCMTLLDCL
jgi:hypothetical protein